MSWIHDDDLKSIRNRADIVDVMSHYIPLNKNGRNYTAKCPFHDDHDPSLNISVDKQIFKCFVCGAGGDVFGFVSKIEQVSFPEAVSKVADLIGYSLSKPIQTIEKKADPNEKYYNINQSYIDFMKYELMTDQGALAYDYLKKRKMNEDILKRFEIGYAPESNQSMRFFQAKKFQIDDLENIGLVRNDIAVFSHRIVIPIHDENGKPIGFTARRLSDDQDVAKYINTSQTILYQKGQVVFNYHRASRYARKAGRCILVEGAMDVLAFEKADLHESVACLGTACTNEQLNLLKKLHVPLTLCYDGDQAGQNATYKFIQMALPAHIEMVIVKNLSAKDPDEIFDEGGKKELESFVQRTISVVDFLFDYLLTIYNLENYEDKKAYAEELYNAISLSCNEFEKGSYLTRISKMTGFDFSHLNQNTRPVVQKKNKPLPSIMIRPLQGRIHAEYEALMMILLSKEACDSFKSEIGFFKDSRCQQLSLYCYDVYREDQSIDFDRLLSRIDEEDIREFFIEMWNAADHKNGYRPDYFQDILFKIKECTLQEQIDQMNKKIEEIADPIEKACLSTDKIQLLKQQKELRKKGGYNGSSNEQN